ncbi:hypothetical protein ACOMICROBIO_FLGHMIGD_02979 [Vibrio sp. B1FLJ16]|uniref:hypothetical protein n=1 Tax=Vibrio sp. B1FLJ16 TaxID=2751178 RepID=UPI0015F6BB4A|nr:hypothetical protein [Vibrio sp. B1FLJ16]CAD7822324.1 hypothetical protein ACOMICROBIO_FLGHMIGD_02979 [Vibrio sp. B1FLJ16]CAE6948729.1 hypothetical protein ACOMICROBIO_FLGHMIGD_02979 [Vibrio sp. B1FLJ16]
MKSKKWIFVVLLLLGGPTLLPFSLELIGLIELFGMLGLWTIYSSYAQYLLNHPHVKYGISLATSWDMQPQMYFSVQDLKAYPQLAVHMLPLRSIVLWSIHVLFWGSLVEVYVS